MTLSASPRPWRSKAPKPTFSTASIRSMNRSCWDLFRARSRCRNFQNPQVEGILRSLEDVALTDPPAEGAEACSMLPQEAEVSMLRAEEENLQQQLQSLLQELEAARQAGPHEDLSQDVSAEIALLGCFQEVAMTHRELLFPEGAPEPLSRDHEVVASYIAENLQVSSRR
ncbi:unnamed protein product [Symbiodinium natans]|uniref:Uncharacterized protein n=1 Tax=Symbiodinium natans TaxID=878477 RepID=A0A812US28_9DINO|nr:unnamed protein product [Symbiodinium natans]